MENIVDFIKDLFDKKNPVIGGNSGRDTKDEDEGKKKDERDIKSFFKDFFAKIEDFFPQTNPTIGGNSARDAKEDDKEPSNGDNEKGSK